MEATPVLKLVNPESEETPHVLVNPGSEAEELWRGRGYSEEIEGAEIQPKRRGRPPGSGKVATE